MFLIKFVSCFHLNLICYDYFKMGKRVLNRRGSRVQNFQFSLTFSNICTGYVFTIFSCFKFPFELNSSATKAAAEVGGFPSQILCLFSDPKSVTGQLVCKFGDNRKQQRAVQCITVKCITEQFIVV